MQQHFVGRLGEDPTLRISDGGTVWMGVSFAIECRVKEGAEWVSKPIWADLKIFGALAERVAEAAAKGTRLIVIGELRPTEYTNKEGDAVKGLELVADSVGMDLRFGLG